MNTRLATPTNHSFAYSISFLLLFVLAIPGIDANAQSNPLPLHRFDLKTSLLRNTVTLTWTTENEQNTNRFLIQRSADGFHYVTIGTLPASGQTNTLTEYQSTDDVPFLIQSSIVFYRIRAEDNIDNRFTYSNIVPVKLENRSDIRIWPNPFMDDLRITYPATSNITVQATIHNMAGIMVCHNIIKMVRGLNQVSVIGSGRLPSGIYTIRLIDHSSGLRHSQQVFK